MTRGYYNNAESGLYYLQSRYYDPQIGRFISPDTPDYLEPDTIGGVDLYAYCGNNPVMRKDPTGHDAIVVVEQGLPILGHIVVYIQDENGVWHKTEYTGDGMVLHNRLNNGSKLGDKGFNNISEVYTDIGNFSHGATHTYIVGDFTESVGLALDTYKSETSFGTYNLLFNSCQTYALGVLREGTASDPNVEKFLHSNLASITAIPSVFEENLDAVANPSTEKTLTTAGLFVGLSGAFLALSTNPIFVAGVLGFGIYNWITNGR